MAEMPFDILNQRLGKLRDNGDIDFDNTAVAGDIDEELQSKFLFFPIAELEAVEIEDDRGNLHAGSGPEHCSASDVANPQWLYNHGMNALALYWRLKKEQDAAAEAENKRIIAARRPEPGVYLASSRDQRRFTILVTEDRRMLAPQVLGAQRFEDVTAIYDASPGGYILQRIDLTDGTVQK